MDKSTLRKSILNKRNHHLFKDDSDNVIAQKLLEECCKFDSVFIYLSYGSEVNTQEVIKELFKLNKNVFVPVCDIDKLTMKPVKITSFDNLTKNKYGILEPPKTNYIDSPNIDAVIFPGVVFDYKGNRIGYGKGYYDRYVSSLGYNVKKIGVCYDFQIVKNIDADAHDMPMDMIITEKRLINI